jgi:hypothetical protein
MSERRPEAEPARLAQARAIAALREQARLAAKGFVEELMASPESSEVLGEIADAQALARALWTEALLIVYRVLFILKLEASPDPALAFRFTRTEVWRTTYSPGAALAPIADEFKNTTTKGVDTGRRLGDSLRGLFRLFEEGVCEGDLRIEPLGGMLFGEGATPLFNRLPLPERAAARLLNGLLWAQSPKSRQRVDYGRLEVEDLGRVYEALLEVEPGIATEPMCRLRRQKLEVVVPIAEGERHRGGRRSARVRWIEEIKPGKFYLRSGLGRRSTGSYYTPPAFVRFLVEEALGPQVTERSPPEDPRPLAILALKVLDPAMGSGHFLVEACRFLGDRLFEACRRCDELAQKAEAEADRAPPDKKRELRELARGLRRRVEDLPDPGGEILARLASRSPNGSGDSEAIAVARRLAALYCLYGVDKNPLAVELAKLSLWITARAEGLPLTFLDHHLIRGDSVAGPFFEQLGTYPKSGGEVPEFAELRARFEASPASGASADLAMLARAWSGGVMLGDQADDEGYRRLMAAVAGARDAGLIIAERPRLAKMLEAGRDALAYDAVFPEVFYPNGLAGPRAGFDAVIGNPPWDAVRPRAKEFFAAIDLRVLDAPTKRERAGVEEELRKDARVAAQESAYEVGLRAAQRLHDRLFKHQTARVGGAKTRGDPDMAKVFAERFVELCRPGGRVGVLLPSAFHANAGATGVRRLYLDEMAILYCISFENRMRLFDIDSRFKYDLLVAAREPPQEAFTCAFYRHDPAWLSGEKADALRYTPRFVAETGGEHRALLELRSAADLAVAERCYSLPARFAKGCAEGRIRFGRELHMTDDAWRFTPAGEALPAEDDPRDPIVMAALLKRGRLLLHDDKTFASLSDLTRKWRPRYLVPVDRLSDRPDWVQAATAFRVAFRKITGATNERTTIAHILPPGSVFGDATFCERDPFARATSRALVLLGLLTSFSFDWLVRLRAQSNLNLFLINATPVPEITAAPMVAHAILRLACNHEGYAPLWREQLGAAWREPSPKNTWPVLSGDDARWQVRAAVDAIIADAYRLSRDQYARVLSGFTHKTYPRAPDLCLDAFDELKARGLEAFAQARDPYWDIELVLSPPEPVIELPRGPISRRAESAIGEDPPAVR